MTIFGNSDSQSFSLSIITTQSALQSLAIYSPQYRSLLVTVHYSNHTCHPRPLQMTHNLHIGGKRMNSLFPFWYSLSIKMVAARVTSHRFGQSDNPDYQSHQHQLIKALNTSDLRSTHNAGRTTPALLLTLLQSMEPSVFT